MPAERVLEPAERALAPAGRPWSQLPGRAMDPAGTNQLMTGIQVNSRTAGQTDIPVRRTLDSCLRFYLNRTTSMLSKTISYIFDESITYGPTDRRTDKSDI